MEMGTSIASPGPYRRVVHRSYDIECPSCHGSGHSQRSANDGGTGFAPCKGCEATGRVRVSETETGVTP